MEVHSLLQVGEATAVDRAIAGIEKAEGAMDRAAQPGIDRGEQPAASEADPGRAEASVPLSSYLAALLIEVQDAASGGGTSQVSTLAGGQFLGVKEVEREVDRPAPVGGGGGAAPGAAGAPHPPEEQPVEPADDVAST